MQFSKLGWLMPLCFLAACGSQERTPGGTYVTNNSSKRAGSHQMAVSKALDTGKMLIRTADVECEVADVLTTVTALERTVRAAGGIIEESTITNVNEHTEDVYYSFDSLKRVTTLRPEAMLVLRVPSARLDSIVNMIPGMATRVRKRRLAQEDVSLRYLENDLLSKRGGHAVPAHVSSLRKKGGAVDEMRYIDASRERDVRRYVENLGLEERVVLSGLTVKLSQPIVTRTTIVADASHAVHVPFLSRCTAAIENGLGLASIIFTALLSVWPLWLVLALVVSVVVRVRSMQQGKKLIG